MASRRGPIPDAPSPKPWSPTPWKPHHARAFQELQAGTADAHLQKEALAWLLEATGIRDLSFRPGEDGARATDFAEGKRFVGLQIAKLLTIRPGAFTAEGKAGQPSEQP